MSAGLPIVGTPGTSIAAQCGSVATGTQINSADVNSPLTSIVNDLATVSGGTWTCQAELTFTGGSVTFNEPVSVPANQSLTMSSGSLFVAHGRTQARARVLLSDANHTIDTSQGDTFVLPNIPAASRLITLSTTTPPPQIGERLRFVVPQLQYSGSFAQSYQFTRTGTPAGLVGKIYSSVTNISAMPVSVEFEFGAGIVLSVTGTASGSGSAVKLTLALPAGTGTGAGNPTDSLATGDQVVVAGVGGTTEANGTQTITVNDGTHITLQGTTYVHSYTSGGTAQITPGTWRLGMNSGSSYDGSAVVGVLSDAAS